jgi:hypothetical protein
LSTTRIREGLVNEQRGLVVRKLVREDIKGKEILVKGRSRIFTSKMEMRNLIRHQEWADSL